MPRAIFEAGLILFGLLGAFALDGWQESRSRAARVEALMAAVRAELEANLRLHEPAATHNSDVANKIWEQATAGATFIPAGTLEGGILRSPQLTSAAWTTAQNDTVVSDVPVEKLLLIAAVYAEQDDYVAKSSALLNSMYAAILQGGNTASRVDGISQPLMIGGVLRDNAGRGQDLIDSYRRALEQL